MGSIVYIHDDVYTSSRIKELTIIDGQQRLTTITLIYLAIYHLAKELDEQGLENEINETYLINKFAPEEEKLKLKPTENNSKALKYLLRGDCNEEFNTFSKLIENFRFFKERITSENYPIVLRGLSKLMFVEISLDKEKDNPQRIFESLNSTGLELTQSDLIRNYILMGLNRREQDKIYRNYWQIIESLAKDETLNKSLVSEFIRDYLTLENKKIPNKNNVYSEFKSKYPINSFEDLENILALKQNIAILKKFISPIRELISKLQARSMLNYFHKDMKYYLGDLNDHGIIVFDTIDMLNNRATELIQLYHSMISNTMNEVMKILAIISTIFMPLSFIVGLYGMNFEYMPELRWHYGYFITLGLMAGLVILMIIYFKKKKWF